MLPPGEATIERREPVSVPAELSREYPPLLAQIYASRGVGSAAELDYSLKRLPDYSSFSDIEAATALLQQALDGQWRILVVGDFDADGATSTAVAVRALRMLGAREVDFLVPNRFEYGYGLTPEIVAVARERRPDLIITVDNGISSLRGVAAAQAAGIRVLVTDHHLPGPQLPSAEAIVNPNREGDRFPGKSLAGVGVIFYLMLALRARLRETGWFEAQGLEPPNLASLLDLVALGTVADVVPLDQINRVLVSQGLARIRAGEGCCGIRALCEVGRREPARLVAADLGFALGPRLNAAGRLDDMSLGIRCLLSDSMGQARALAGELDRLNQERREIETSMREEALAQLDGLMEQTQADDSLPLGLCLYRPDWHQGVLGILASRIKDRLHRPVIVLADDKGGAIKGSARSVKGLHIRDILADIDTAHPGMLRKFGGHAMAAGLTLEPDTLEPFQAAFDQAVRRHLGEAELGAVLLSDGALPHEQINLEFARQLREAGPWGQGFEEPLFDGRFELLSQRVVGERHLKLVLRPEGGEVPVEAIAFNPDLERWPEEVEAVHLVYRLDVNEFRGTESAQLMVDYLLPVD